MDGVELAVLREEPALSPLVKADGSHVEFRGRRILTLADGTKVDGCADCDVTGTRGGIVKHRMDEHGAKRSPGGGKRKDKDSETDDADPSMVLFGLSSSVASMTIWEFVELAMYLGDVEDVIAEREKYKALAKKHEAELRKVKTSLGRLVGSPAGKGA